VFTRHTLFAAFVSAVSPNVSPGPQASTLRACGHRAHACRKFVGQMAGKGKDKSGMSQQEQKEVIKVRHAAARTESTCMHYMHGGFSPLALCFHHW
jgi:hypothetical protein